MGTIEFCSMEQFSSEEEDETVSYPRIDLESNIQRKVAKVMPFEKQSVESDDFDQLTTEVLLDEDEAIASPGNIVYCIEAL